MIPHFAPPFGLGRAVAAWLSPMPAPGIASLENEYAHSFGTAEAVIVPSVRAAMLMLFQQTPADTLVVGPAFTCMVVHEAMVLSGRRLKWVEPAPASYLISDDALRDAAEPGMCLVLSEMYGIPYPASTISSTNGLRPGLRVIDMAMSIPDRRRLESLSSIDVALVSFGFGKSLCAGGGAVALLNDADRASRLRRARDEATPTHPDREQHGSVRTLASFAARTRLGCSATHLIESRRRTAASPASPAASNAPKPVAQVQRSHEWSHRMTPMERRLAIRNLYAARASAALRHQQAQLYLSIFGTAAIGVDIGLPQSHFPVRVPMERRAAVIALLHSHGFEAGSEFPLSGLIRASDFPRTKQVCDEIVTLPLGEQVSEGEIRQIAQLVHPYLTA